MSEDALKDTDRIIFILRGTGATSCSSVAKVLRISSERTHRALCELRTAGKVVHLGPSKWGLTDKGCRIADDDLLNQMRLFETAAV